MPLYRVVNRYRDRATGQRVAPGAVVRLAKPTGDRMIERGLVELVERDESAETAAAVPAEHAARRVQPPQPKHVGGGWYELPDGEKVQGRAAAMRRMEEVD